MVVPEQGGRALITKPLVGSSERRALEILERSLAGSDYRAFSKVRMNDVVAPSPGEELAFPDRNFLMTAHFDFVVYKREALTSVAAISPSRTSGLRPFLLGIVPPV